jgi:L-malate glycosyltransferase
MPFKILLLADINSTHTQKWALSLAEKGHHVGIFTFSKLKIDWINDKRNIQFFHIPSNESIPAMILKGLHPFDLPELKNVIKEFKPDIVHAHYATTYGFLGALSRFHPFVLSVWGSDVFSFPKTSFLHKWILKFNLSRADRICSTSNIMKEEIKLYTDKDITVIPFGIDLNVFKPLYARHVFKDDAIVIGTVKQLEKAYGLEYLIEAVALLKKRIKEYKINLLIVGGGSLEVELKEKAKDLGIQSNTIFTGYIPPVEIPYYQNMPTISVFPSLSESFGVSVAEAMACEKPVIVTNVGGLPEVVENNVTGLIVPPANAEKLAEAIETLVRDEQLRTKLGKQGRQRVERLYNWEHNLSSMIRVYEELAPSKK